MASGAGFENATARARYKTSPDRPIQRAGVL